MEVARQQTPLSLLQLRDELPAAFARRGVVLDGTSGTMLAALVWLETDGGESLFNNNVGNLAHPGSGAGDWWPAPWRDAWEIEQLPEGPRKDRYRENWQLARQGLAPTAFRSYPTAVEGIQAFADLLTGSRYRALLREAQLGDVDGFSSEIKASGYTPTADPVAHARSMRQRIGEVEPFFSNLGKTPRSGKPWGLVGLLALAAGLAAALVRGHHAR